jgi:hypothetical protein
MTEEEVLAMYRQKRQNPNLPLATAMALHGLESKFGYLHAENEGRQHQDPQPR